MVYCQTIHWLAHWGTTSLGCTLMDSHDYCKLGEVVVNEQARRVLTLMQSQVEEALSGETQLGLELAIAGITLAGHEWEERTRDLSQVWLNDATDCNEYTEAQTILNARIAVRRMYNLLQPRDQS